MARRRKVRRLTWFQGMSKSMRARDVRRERWIQRALRRHKKGSLHRQLGVSRNKKIPLGVLRRAATKPGLLGMRARLALRLRSFRHKRSR